MVTIHDYYWGRCYDECNNWPTWMIQSDFDKAWREHDMQEAEDKKEHQELISLIDRMREIQRIAREARIFHISYETIYRFIREYNLNGPERVEFWLNYYSFYCGW